MSFSDETIQFLMENRINNSRDWYQTHKPQYQELVLKPQMELVERLTPVMLSIDPELVVEPKVDKTISRIYRDTRFSRDKSLYRDVAWCVFGKDKKRFLNAPGFVFEFSPYQFRWGCGWFSTPTETMQAMRRLILEKDKSFLAARRAYEKQTTFDMEGESYKRPKYPDQPAELQTWLNRKSIAFLHNSEDFDLLFSEDLPEVIAKDFLLLKPIYEFLCKACGY